MELTSREIIYFEANIIIQKLSVNLPEQSFIAPENYEEPEIPLCARAFFRISGFL